MKIENITEKSNPVMNRKEIHGEITFDNATPGRYDIKLAIAKQIKADADLVILRRVRNVFGEKKIIFDLHVYAAKKDIEKVSKVLVNKNKGPAKSAEEPKVETPKVEAKPEEPKVETPKAEEKPAEPKVEAKPEEPKVETPKVEAKPEEPKVEAKPEEPKVETPKAEEKPAEPKVEAKPEEPKVETPKVEALTIQSSQGVGHEYVDARYQTVGL